MADDQPVPWESCSHDGCIGVRLATAVWCLAHAATRDLPAFDAEFKRIGEDDTVDARGVQFATELLQRLLEALPYQDECPVLKAAQFEQATFQGGMGFDGAIFLDETNF
jgi:hypothetical protein